MDGSDCRNETEADGLTQEESNPMHQIGNINLLDIENLFTGYQVHKAETEQVTFENKARQVNQGKLRSSIDKEETSNHKLSYNNYCAVTQDFGTHRIDEEALKVLETFGFPRQLVIRSLNQGELNHATTTYNLLVTS